MASTDRLWFISDYPEKISLRGAPRSASDHPIPLLAARHVNYWSFEPGVHTALVLAWPPTMAEATDAEGVAPRDLRDLGESTALARELLDAAAESSLGASTAIEAFLSDARLNDIHYVGVGVAPGVAPEVATYLRDRFFRGVRATMGVPDGVPALILPRADVSETELQFGDARGGFDADGFTVLQEENLGSLADEVMSYAVSLETAAWPKPATPPPRRTALPGGAPAARRTNHGGPTRQLRRYGSP